MIFGRASAIITPTDSLDCIMVPPAYSSHRRRGVIPTASKSSLQPHRRLGVRVSHKAVTLIEFSSWSTRSTSMMRKAANHTGAERSNLRMAVDLLRGQTETAQNFVPAISAWTP